jgi:F-type H+-transporting ATPase subunit alpha
MFNSGQRPAINLGISVSRVGGSAQIKAMKQVVGSLKIDMAQFRELAAFAQFGSDLDAKTKAQLERGQRITEILKQGWEEPLPVTLQVFIFWAISKGKIDQVQIPKVKEWEIGFIEYVKSNYQDLLDQLKSTGKIDDQLEHSISQAVDAYNQTIPELLIPTKE